MSNATEFESDVEILQTAAGTRFVRTPDARFATLPGYPFEPHYATVDGLRMHYVDEGPRNGEVVLMLHGQPTWSYLYRKLIAPLAAAGHRAIAPDLIGMGRSDKPVSLEIHTLEQQVEWVAEFIETLGLRAITLFGQDWGSIIGLRLVGDHPDWFARVVISNGDLPDIPAGMNPFPNPNRANAVLDPTAAIDLRAIQRQMSESESPIEAFQRWIQYSLTNPDFSAGHVVDVNTVSTLSEDELAAYDAPFPSPVYRAAPRTFPAMVTAIAGENGPAWKNLEKFTKPFLTVFGERDPLLGGKRTQDGLTQRIPGAANQPHERVDADHFIQEDVGPLLAKRIDALIVANPLE